MAKLSSVARLFSVAPTFGTMSPRQQAAFRATLTRYRNEITDADILGELDALQEMIGESESPSRQRVTVDDVIAEYPQYADYSPRQRAAYKAKVTRMLNEATEGGEVAEANRLGEVLRSLAAAEVQEQKDKIKRLADMLRKS